MGYKETLNLPRTGFPMKGNLARKEPEIQEFWDKLGLYKRIMAKTAGMPLFVLHDGPPYANGDIHVGTAYNKILKDIIVKYKTMRGHQCPYVPGWDCHGQPIEHEVSKRLGPEASLDKVELRKTCREYALKFVKRQAEQFKRLGVLGDFDDPYLTLATRYEATNVEVFAELYAKGLIYRGRKPIHWCTDCVTALSEAEIEYEDKQSNSMYVRFPLVDEFPLITRSGKRASLLIWTTTPWTLPANVAIALHPRLHYAGVDTGDEVLVMAHALVEPVMKELEIADFKVIDEFLGSEVEGLNCSHPWFDRDSVIVLADYVTLDQGTGCVHIAPGHGQEDYLTGLEYGLPSPMPVDDLGFFTEEGGPFAGMSLEEANPKIIEDLQGRGLLMASGYVTHQYPHCWRCKKPVVFRATPQWFIALDGNVEEDRTLRGGALHAIKDVEWIPDWTINRIGSMVENRPDWCISRQRAWGVPLPVLYCLDCGKELITPDSLEAIRVMIESEGADSWFIREPVDFLPPGTKCEYCSSEKFEKESDILDVWFESGISHLAVLREREELRWPADLYVEGSDQHRGWFQSSLLTSIGFTGKPPYRAVITHGFTVDGEGRKMSKSLGNAIDPREVYSRSGADILRLWTASTDYSSDIPISEEILSRVTEAYRRIRNTIRFMLGNTYDFEEDKNAVPHESMEEIDRWMLSRLQNLVKRVTSLMDRYLYHQAVQVLLLFCTVDMSSLYMDILKDRLYTFPADSAERRSAQTAMSRILGELVVMIAPVLPHTAEEAWISMSEGRGQAESVHLAPWPEYDESLVDAGLDEKWARILEIREDVYRKMEKARQDNALGTSLEALVRIYARGTSLELLESMKPQLPAIFIVSQAEVHDLSEYTEERQDSGDVEVLIERAKGSKCERCWNYTPAVGQDNDNPDICERCAAALAEE